MPGIAWVTGGAASATFKFTAIGRRVSIGTNDTGGDVASGAGPGRKEDHS